MAAAIAIAMVALTAANQAQAPLPAEPIPIESVQEDLSQDEIAQISEQLENENQKISIDDTITVTGDASIYDNQYDAHHQTNKMKPLYESNKEREVIGASVRMSDGTLKFVQDNDLLNVLMEQGGEVVSYLTGTEAEPEGFWNENDCIKVNQMNMEKGGINR